MNTSVFIALLALLQLICFWVSRTTSKNVKNQHDYFLANKDIRFFSLLMTFVATQIGGGLILGSAEEAYRFGWSVLLYPLGACLGFVVLALGPGKKLASYQVSTVAELVGVFYRSNLLKKITSSLSIISLFMILMAQVIASRKFMVSLGVDNSFLFLAFWGIVIIYTVMGGLRGVVSIDIVQALFFMIVFTTGLIFILYKGSFSVSQIIEGGWNSEAFEMNIEKFSGWLLMPLFFMLIEQDMAQRCFAAHSPKVVSKAAAYAAICTLSICIIPVFLGILGKQTGVNVPSGSSVFMDVIKVYTNPFISAFIGCAVLMAILSTAISLLNAVSSNLAQDFDFSHWQETKTLQFSRRMTTGIGLAAVSGSYFMGEIVGLLIQSYELSVYCLLVPVCAALFKRQGNALSAWLAVLFGAAAFIFSREASFLLPKELIGLLLSATGYLIGEAWSAYGISQAPENIS